MSKLSIKQLFAATTLVTLLGVPTSALALVSPDAQSAATAGIQYLATNQKSDGSISGFGGESEWSVEALAAGGQQASTFAHGGSTSLLDFLKTDAPGATTSPTTVERKIIAIGAASQDATSFGGVNYDALLESKHNNSQIGDPTLLNDDIFGIIAIDAAHANQLQAEAQDGLDYLLAHQAADGGFSYTTDTSAGGSDTNDTSATIIAMYAAQDLGLVQNNLASSRDQALSYLLSTQNPDGGFGYDGFSPSDGSSTAWSLMALNAIGDSVSAQAQLARNWLLHDQNTDGGFSYGAYGVTDSDTYTTAHAVTALLGSTWLLRPTPPSLVITPQPPASVSGGSSGQQAPSTSSSSSSPPQPAQTQSPQTTTRQPAVTLASNQTPIVTPTDTPTIADTTDNTSPQVKADSIVVQPTHKVASTIVSKSNHTQKYALYGVVLLGLVAGIWFVLESRQSRRGN
jgi:prenyltransferase beta subunit